MDKVQEKAKVCSQVGGLRPLLVAMMVGGQLYHIRDKTHSPPVVRIYPPLAIWAVILGLWIFALNIFTILDDTFTQSSILLVLSDLSYLVTICLYCTLVTTRSHQLARLLNHLEDIECHLMGAQERRPRMLSDRYVIINMMVHVIMSVSCVHFVQRVHGIIVVVYTMLVVVHVLVTSCLFRVIFRLLAWNLQLALDEARTPSHVVGGSRSLDVHRLQAVCLRVSVAVWLAGEAAWQTKTNTRLPKNEELFLYFDL